MEITVDLEKLSVDTRKHLACDLTDSASLLLLAIDSDKSVRATVAKNASISIDIIYILSRDEENSVILALLKSHQLEEANISFLAEHFKSINCSCGSEVRLIKTYLIKQENISSESLATILVNDPYPSLLYEATFKDQASSDTLKFILKANDCGLTISRALKHKNTRFEDIEEYVFSHKYNFDYDFYDAKLYLSHPQTSPKSICLFAKYIVKQYMNSNRKGQTSFEYLLIEIASNPKTSTKTLDWLVKKICKKHLLCNDTMLKRFKKALESNPNVTENILFEASED